MDYNEIPINLYRNTSGPWEKQTIGCYATIQPCDRNLNGGWAIASLCGDDALGNATLIAAAPDILVALERVVGICQESLKDHFGDETAKIISAAIAKARGQQS